MSTRAKPIYAAESTRSLIKFIGSFNTRIHLTNDNETRFCLWNNNIKSNRCLIAQCTRECEEVAEEKAEPSQAKPSHAQPMDDSKMISSIELSALAYSIRYVHMLRRKCTRKHTHTHSTHLALYACFRLFMAFVFFFSLVHSLCLPIEKNVCLSNKRSQR